MDLPLAVPFDSIGLFSPYPTVESLSSEIPFSIKAAFTASALLSKVSDYKPHYHHLMRAFNAN